MLLVPGNVYVSWEAKIFSFVRQELELSSDHSDPPSAIQGIFCSARERNL